MDIKQLRLFLTLADTLHFGKTSEICHVSPSALSRHIKQIEDQLGVTLFLRDNRSVELTRDGKRFQRYARDTLQQWETFQTTLLSESQELQGEISLFCSVTASYSFLYDIISEFRQKYSRIDFKLHTGDTSQAIHRVQSGMEDVAIAARPEKLPPQLAFKRITVSPLVFISPAEQLMDNKLHASIQANDWGQIPMILPESGISRGLLDNWYKDQGIQPRIYAQVAGHEAMVSMAGLGFGVAVVPQIVLDNSPLAGRVQVVKQHPQLGSYEVGLCALEKRLKNPLLHAFWYG